MADDKETCSDNKMDVQDSSGSKDLSKSLPVEAFNNFLQGKRHMLVQDFQNAVSSLVKACEMYSNHFGEMAIECAEVYFLYGKALFRLSQQQSGVLGGAINDGSNEESSSESEGNENESDKNSDEGDGEDEENESEEKEDQEKEEKEPSESTDSPPAVVDEASSEAKVESNSEAKVESNSEAKVESNSEVKVESNSEAKTGVENLTKVSETSGDKIKENSTDEPEVPETAEGIKKEGADENNEAEEVEDDLELAWNSLETAKSIFKRRDTVESHLKVAEILQLLAEISMESDNNAAAINDLKESLEIQKKHLKPDDRILAETYYQMGLALMLDKQYPDALENFQTTKKILELRVENLKNTPVDEADGTFASADIKAEISDLENVLLDIKEKIDDTEELICNKKKEMEELIEEPGFSSPLKERDEKSSPSKPVSNITHLLKRKKPDEGSSDENPKRIKVGSVLNG